MPVKDRLETLARLGGFANVSALARHAVVTEGAMRQHIARDKMPYGKARQYVDACDGVQATPEWLMTGKGAPPERIAISGSDKIVLLENRTTRNLPPRPNGLRNITGDLSDGKAVSRVMDTDFPVYGAVDSGGGVVALSAEPDFKVERPAWSKSAKDFSYFVQTDAMGPHPGRGDRVEINTSVPANPGDLVVLISGERPENWRAMLRELVKIDDGHWRVKQYNPDKSENFSRDTWHTAYKVSGIHKR